MHEIRTSFIEGGKTKKVKTIKVFEPNKSDPTSEILEIVKASQGKLHKFVDDRRQLITERIVFPSQISMLYVYPFDTVIEILVNYQKRLFLQARNIKYFLIKLN